MTTTDSVNLDSPGECWPLKRAPAHTPYGRVWSGRFYSRLIGMGFDNNTAVVIANHAATVVLEHLDPPTADAEMVPLAASAPALPEGFNPDFIEAVRLACLACFARKENLAQPIMFGHLQDAWDMMNSGTHVKATTPQAAAEVHPRSASPLSAPEVEGVYALLRSAQDLALTAWSHAETPEHVDRAHAVSLQIHKVAAALLRLDAHPQPRADG